MPATNLIRYSPKTILFGIAHSLKSVNFLTAHPNSQIKKLSSFMFSKKCSKRLYLKYPCLKSVSLKFVVPINVLLPFGVGLQWSTTLFQHAHQAKAPLPNTAMLHNITQLMYRHWDIQLPSLILMAQSIQPEVCPYPQQASVGKIQICLSVRLNYLSFRIEKKESLMIKTLENHHQLEMRGLVFFLNFPNFKILLRFKRQVFTLLGLMT